MKSEQSHTPIHNFFGLSYASYLVIPRSILQSCTPEAQQKLCDALEEVYKETKAHMDDPWPYEATISVQLRDVVTGRLKKDDLADYQRGRRRLW